MCDRRRLSASDKAEEAAQCGEAAVARADGVPAFMLRMVQEPAHLSREVHNRHLDQKQKRGEIMTLDLTLTPKDKFCERGEVLEVETP